MPDHLQREDRTERARDLRQQRTLAERILWSLVRGRQLDGCKFRRQVPIGRYFADFACIEARLIIELDGSQHADQIEYDEARTRDLERYGFRVIRFWNASVLSAKGSVIDRIRAELALARNQRGS